jgi:hypothetical protein
VDQRSKREQVKFARGKYADSHGKKMMGEGKAG